ncbi:MAG: putative rRNA maturation factor [Pseudomonadota bacterium]|nr:putative rRNA maturation factor [Pseudomonadota bacterium]
MTASRRLNLSVQYACNADGLPSRVQVRQWARAALEGGGQVTVRYVDAAEGQVLNNDYRGKNYATNVLSFVYENDPLTVGDLVICAPVVAREAGEQKRALEAHHAHLVVHGMLHLQGYEHETCDEDARIMEEREREILAELGYPDPYREG